MDIFLEDFYKGFDGFSVSVPSLTVDDGEFFGVVGPSGCGKTTLLRLIAGLIPSDRGRILCGGRDISRLSPENRNFGFVFQGSSLFPYMSVEDNVAFGLRMRGIPKKERLSMIEDLLLDLGLDGLEKRYPEELSGGQAQRVAIGRALAFRPDVLLMDEPFSSLDPNLRRDMRRLIHRLHRSMGLTTIFVSHDRDDAFDLFDRVAFMKGGVIAEIGRPVDLYESPGSLDTADFMGVVNMIPATREAGLTSLAGVSFLSEGEDGEGHLLIRPELFRIGEGPWRGRIVDVRVRQGEFRLSLDVEGRLLEARTLSGCFVEGDHILFDIKRSDVKFLM